ncbi:Geranylgeranyl diphosphate synthase [uncultured archaeon]|nr:Geranylgeranyl diphosphate synthase [uncultured archaeon]
MDYTAVLDRFGCLIEDDLKRQFDQLTKEASDYHPFMGEVYDAAGEFVLRGGRRLSSCSTLIVYKGYTNEINDSIVRACSGVELYRHSILVHDDIADTELQRMGGKTLHKIFEERQDEHFGIGSAIFIGNILYSLAIRAVLESGFDSSKLVRVTNRFSSDFKDINESQILDLLFEYKGPNVGEWTVMASKRAASLFRTSLLTGAVLASAPEKDYRLLEDAGRHIGYAFDIQDDIIDTFASKDQYGRVPCGDVSKRKKPLHLILALEMEKNGRLAKIMESGNKITDDDIKDIQDLIRDSGALEEAKSISRNHAMEAARQIPETEMNEEAKDFFVSFISYVAESLDWYK